MKATPILVITNVVALCMVALLYLNQLELKDQLGNARQPASRAPSADLAEAERFDALERRIAALTRLIEEPAGMMAEGDLPTGSDDSSVAGEGGEMDADGFALPEIEGAGEDGLLPTNPKMEIFRRQVRRANDLNSQEDRVQRMNDSLDRLVEQNRIGALDPVQREAVTTALLRARTKIPQVMQKLRSDQTMADLPREERRELWRSAFEGLQTETQKELESAVPAADAKVISDSMAREAMGGGRGRGR
jgi:hypothetical protein